MKTPRASFLPFAVVCWLLGCVLSASAQSSPAFDSAVYIPTEGKPSEFDTIIGRPGESLGFQTVDIGHLPGDAYNTILIEGANRAGPFLSGIETGPSFNLHQLKSRVQTNLGENIFGPGFRSVRLGHFHSTHINDLLTIGDKGLAIYWADDNGSFDSNRFTQIYTKHQGDLNTSFPEFDLPFSGKLTNDSLDDILVIGIVGYGNAVRDSTFGFLYKGGLKLFNAGTLGFEDSAFFLNIYLQDQIQSYFGQGDFRGIGRNDMLIETDSNDIFYYRNDLPFSFERFKHSFFFDTLISHTENRIMPPNFDIEQVIAMQVFPRHHGDKSADVVFPVLLKGDNHLKVVCFRGGDSFGSKRLLIDSADFTFNDPSYYDSRFANVSWGEPIFDAGDMTGTGNRVLHCNGTDRNNGYEFYYVTGKALDEKIDMTYATATEQLGVDTLTANNDGLTDVLTSAIEDPTLYTGGLGILYGSKKIPVRLSPTYAVEESRRLEATPLLFYPNPAHRQTTFTFQGDGHFVTITLIDLLGREVYRSTRPTLSGTQVLTVTLPKLSSGVYVANIESVYRRISARLSILN